MEEKEEAAPPEQDGWLEVGKRNRTVVTRTVGILSRSRRWYIALRQLFFFVTDKSYGVTDNADIWWKVQVDITCPTTKGFCHC